MDPARVLTGVTSTCAPIAHLGRSLLVPAFVTAADCRSSSLNAPAIAKAPLTPVPATMQTTVLYWAGFAIVKYGPSRRREIGNFLDGTAGGGGEDLSTMVIAESCAIASWYANSASLSVHCDGRFDLVNLETVLKNDDTKPGLTVVAVSEGVGLGAPRFRNRN